jgi:hypothetical protein
MSPATITLYVFSLTETLAPPSLVSVNIPGLSPLPPLSSLASTNFSIQVQLSCRTTTVNASTTTTPDNVQYLFDFDNSKQTTSLLSSLQDQNPTWQPCPTDVLELQPISVSLVPVFSHDFYSDLLALASSNISSAQDTAIILNNIERFVLNTIGLVFSYQILS